MLHPVILLSIFCLPALVTCVGDGNIKLLEDEVANALKICAETDSKKEFRQKRFADNNSDDKRNNQYGHERRNASDMRNQVLVVNASDYDYEGFGAGNEGEKLVNSMPRNVYNVASNNSSRNRRSEPLFTKPDTDQCLSQCVFANLQVVDSRGIPRETELWNKVQSSVTSQQSRSALRDQIGACFQELQSDAEDNGCSYSNKLERCLMLRFSERKPQEPSTEDGNTNKNQS